MSSPIGTEMTVASPVMSSVPMIAWAAPPPSPSTFRMESVKKSRSMRPDPITTTVYTSETSGIIATVNAAMTSVVTRRSAARRGPSTRSEIT